MLTHHARRLPPRLRVNILVVDDHPDLCRILKRYLNSRGYSAACVSSGKAALQHLHDHVIHLMVLDWAMPEMSGFDVLRAVKANAETADIPVVIYSAMNDREQKRRALMAGAADFLVKCAVDLNEFDAIVERHALH
jgi:DNA-binding response OmpR family regulator